MDTIILVEAMTMLDIIMIMDTVTNTAMTTNMNINTIMVMRKTTFTMNNINMKNISMKSTSMKKNQRREETLILTLLTSMFLVT